MKNRAILSYAWWNVNEHHHSQDRFHQQNQNWRRARESDLVLFRIFEETPSFWEWFPACQLQLEVSLSMWESPKCLDNRDPWEYSGQIDGQFETVGKAVIVDGAHLYANWCLWKSQGTSYFQEEHVEMDSCGSTIWKIPAVGYWSCRNLELPNCLLWPAFLC